MQIGPKDYVESDYVVEKNSKKRPSRPLDSDTIPPDLMKKIKPGELAEQLALGNKKITKSSLAELRKEMPALAARYDQLGKLPDFEHKPLLAKERMHLAYLIEVEAPKIKNIRDAHLISTGPRDVYVTKKRRVVVMATPTKSQLSAKGSWKEVFSGVKLSKVDKPAKPVAVARIPLKIAGTIKAVDEEMAFFQRLQKAKVPGIAKMRFYTDITGLKKNPEDYVHKFPVEDYTCHKVAAFDRYERSLETETNLTLPEKISVAKQVLETVKKMHDAGVIHWDLKRENVLIRREDGKPITGVTDFGLSFDRNEPYDFDNYGTALSTAPELINQAHFKGDVVKAEAWSLGILLYEMLFEKPVPWKEPLPQAEELVKLPGKKQTSLLGKMKKDIPHHVEGFTQRITKLVRQKNRSPQEELELIIYGLLRVDPSQRISVDEAFEQISKLR